MRSRYAITRINRRGETEYYAGSRDGQPIWDWRRASAMIFRGEMEYDAAITLAHTIGGRVADVTLETV